MTYVLIFGTPMDGFVIVGPFASKDAAKAYAQSEPNLNEQWWIAPLETPVSDDG